MSNEIDDWVLVPKTPTEAMLAAGSAKIGYLADSFLDSGDSWIGAPIDVFNAMLEAAPKPAGLVIVPATSDLLRRGEDAVEGGKVR